MSGAPPESPSDSNVRELRLREPQPAGLAAKLGAELRSRPFAYIVLGLFVLVGPVVTHFLFPEAPVGVGVIGGVAFGVVAAICAVPDKFL